VLRHHGRGPTGPPRGGNRRHRATAYPACQQLKRRLTQPTISHHLKILVEAGIFSRDKRRVWAYYALVPSALDALSAVLSTHPETRTGLDRPPPGAGYTRDDLVWRVISTADHAGTSGDWS
jgi:Bacterial regulatory protein, arsR family